MGFYYSTQHASTLARPAGAQAERLMLAACGYRPRLSAPLETPAAVRACLA